MNFDNRIMEILISSQELDKAETRVKAKALAYVRLKKQTIVFSFKRLILPLSFSCALGLVLGFLFSSSPALTTKGEVALSTSKNLIISDNSDMTIIYYDKIMEKFYE